MIVRVETRGPGTMAATAFGMALAPSASIAAWDGGFLVATGERWQLEQWDTAGRLSRVVRVALPPTLATQEAFADYVEADLRQMRGYSQSFDLDSARTALLARPHADTVAAHGRVLSAFDGTLWVLDYQHPADSGWAATVVAPDGRILGRIERPDGQAPVAIGGDRLAFRTEDDVGIATITVHRLRMP